MNLFIIRHAWAEEHDPERWPDDSARPLTSLGIERFKTLVRTLAGREFKPEIVATSPYVRCVQTADIVSVCAKGDIIVDRVEALEPGSDIDAMIAWTNKCAAKGFEEVAWVGHAPDVGDLAGELIGNEAAVRFAKGAIAMISFDSDKIIAGEGELRWLVTAKILGL